MIIHIKKNTTNSLTMANISLSSNFLDDTATLHYKAMNSGKRHILKSELKELFPKINPNRRQQLATFAAMISRITT